MLHAKAHKILFNRARALRKKMTPAEDLLWQRINGRRFLNLKFRRQHPFGDFIFDFFCFEKKIAIEVDGGVHDTSLQRERDAWRTEMVAACNVSIFRIRNEAVLENLEATLEKLAASISPLL